MASEPSNLRHLFGETPTPSIDVSSVIRRSRARRAPRLLGAGAIAVLAVGGLAYGGFSGLAGLGGASTASDSGGAAPTEEQGAEMLSTADGSLGSSAKAMSFCGGVFLQPPPSESGLVLSVAFPAIADRDAAAIDGTATLTNTGTTTVIGDTDAMPMITLSQAGTVVWHSIVDEGDTRAIDLDPGETLDYPVTVTPVVCEPGDDVGDGLRSDLPPVPSGSYQVSAAIDLIGAAPAVVSGPVQDIELR